MLANLLGSSAMDDKFDLKYFKDIISKMVDCLGIHVFHTEKLQLSGAIREMKKQQLY